MVEVTGLEPVTLLPVGRYRNQLYRQKKTTLISQSGF